MADIAAANIGAWERSSWGNKYCCYAKIKGDGTGVTVQVPLGRIEAAWTNAIDDVTANVSIVPGISVSGRTVTYAAAPTQNKYHYLFAVGTD